MKRRRILLCYKIFYRSITDKRGEALDCRKQSTQREIGKEYAHAQDFSQLYSLQWM